MVHSEVRTAQREGAPIVALESAVVTSGLPREAVGGVNVDALGWRSGRPVNLEVALLMHRAVREAGAVPAMVAVIDGTLRIGLDDREIECLATDVRAGKASIANLATCIASRVTAGTTVSATLHACALAHASPDARAGEEPAAARLRVFATGGIGGVHPRAQQSLDVSPDLIQLARSPILTVCSGAKSILDIPATLEALETLGVPVLGWRTDRFPQFFTGGTDDCPVSHRVESAGEVEAVCRTQWDGLNLQSGILLANTVPMQHVLDAGEIGAFIAQAQRHAVEHNVSGQRLTPFLLAEIARLSGNRTLLANIALLESNARLAAEIARTLSG